MAVIKFGVMVVGARGTIGGATYSASKSGPYVRNWSKSSNPRTPRQSASRTRLTNLGADWQALAPATKSAWVTYAADITNAKTDSLGQTYYTTGFNWFLSCQFYRLTSGFTVSTAAPAVGVPTAPTLSACTIRPAASGGSSFTLSTGQYLATHAAFFYARPWNSVGRQTSPNKKWLIYAANPGATATINITTALADAFGDPQVGQRYFVALARSNTTGRCSPFTTLTVDVT